MLGQEINHAQNDYTFISAKLFPDSDTADAALENLLWGLPIRAPVIKLFRLKRYLLGRALSDSRIDICTLTDGRQVTC